MHYELTSGEQG